MRAAGLPYVPLNTSQNSCYIICGTSAVLKDIQAQLSRTVDVRVKHLADELDPRRFVRVLLFKVHD